MSVGITQFKKISSITSTSVSDVQSQTLPLDVLGAIYCELSITHTNAGSSPSLNTNNMMGVISDLSIIVNGTSRRVSLPGFALPLLSYSATGHAVESNFVTTTSTQVTSTIGFVIPFANMGPQNNSQASVRPQDSYIDLRPQAGVETASIQVQFATPTITNVTSFDSVTLSMTALANTGISEDITFGIREMRFNTITLDATGAKQLNLAVGGGTNQYKAIQLIGRNSSGVLTDNNTLYDNVILESLGFEYYNSASGIIDTINNYSGVPSTTGLQILPLYVYGRLSGRLVASNVSQLQLELNSLVTNSSTITVVQDMINFAPGS
jgi:hypothetical protein